MSTCWLFTAGQSDEGVVDLDIAEMKIIHYCMTDPATGLGFFLLEDGSRKLVL
jgi:hypothetical protein